MGRPVRVISVEHLGDRVLKLVFTDGLVRELDFEDALPGVLAEVDDDDMFSTAAVDPIAGTLTWSTGVDFDPDVLRGDQVAASGHQPRLLAEYHLQEAT